MISSLITVIESITEGKFSCDNSEVNFIGDVALFDGAPHTWAEKEIWGTKY